MNDQEVLLRVRIPRSLVEELDRHIKASQGRFMNRSELVRTAIRHYLWVHLRNRGED